MHLASMQAATESTVSGTMKTSHMIFCISVFCIDASTTSRERFRGDRQEHSCIDARCSAWCSGGVASSGAKRIRQRPWTARRTVTHPSAATHQHPPSESSCIDASDRDGHGLGPFPAPDSTRQHHHPCRQRIRTAAPAQPPRMAISVHPRPVSPDAGIESLLQRCKPAQPCRVAAYRRPIAGLAQIRGHPDAYVTESGRSPEPLRSLSGAARLASMQVRSPLPVRTVSRAAPARQEHLQHRTLVSSCGSRETAWTIGEPRDAPELARS